jgi:hypothetical protein
MSDDWRFPTAHKEVPSVTSNHTSAVNPHDAPDVYNSAKLIAEIERLRAHMAKLRAALTIAETYVALSCDETDREEAAEAELDLNIVRAALKETER